MTDPQFTALVQALPAIITAIGVLFIGVLAALTRKRDAKADEKADGIAKEVTQIHTVTNSNLSDITAELKNAVGKISSLEQQILAMNKAKDVADDVAKTLAEKVPSAKDAKQLMEAVVVVPAEPDSQQKPKPPSKK